MKKYFGYFSITRILAGISTKYTLSQRILQLNPLVCASIQIQQVILSDEFDILQIVGEGWFGKILLVEHRATDTEMVLKALPKPYVSLRDFYREFHYGLHLGVHKNIVTTYDVAFETAGFYVFTQEYATLGMGVFINNSNCNKQPKKKYLIEQVT